ncbi:DUF6350 family protein [Corynebacterium anserum]|uniref:cell division protein PerM n=1 Tax=Corynebacterium anserum TaxID=2684406 RepID=UPI001C8E720A|nr:DUF6350 family protein [Corynebacterium anserum]
MNNPSARRPSTSRRRTKSTTRNTQQAKPEHSESSEQRFVDERHGEGRSIKAASNKASDSAARKAPRKTPRRTSGKTSGEASSKKASSRKAALGKTRTAAAANQQWQKWKPHVQRFALPLLINYGVTLGIIIAIAVVVGVGAGFSRVPATIGSLWMVLNLGALEMTGATLGFLPLLPAMIMVWVYSRRATRILGTKVSVLDLRAFVALSLVIPTVLTLVAWLMLWDASRVFDIAAPNVVEALVSTVLVNGAAVVIGMRPRIWRALLLRRDMPTWPVEAFRLAGSFLGWMFLVGMVASLVYAATNYKAVLATYDITNDLMGALGLTILALMYVPNIAIGAMAVLLGGEFHIGNAVFSLFSSTNVSLPPLPILAAIPNQTLSGGPFFLAIPAIVSLVVVFRFVKSRGFIESPVAMSVGAGASVALLGFCLAWLSGGKLGVYGSAGALEWLCAAEVAAWLMLPALVVMFWVARAGRTVVEDVDVVRPSSTDATDESQGEPKTADERKTVDEPKTADEPKGVNEPKGEPNATEGTEVDSESVENDTEGADARTEEDDK